MHWIGPAVLGDADLGRVIRSMHLALYPPDVVRGQVWQLATYVLVHDPLSPWHAILNLVFCWLFGAGLELRWGTRRFLHFYLLCGALAGGIVLGWSAFWSSAVRADEWTRFTFGASGAVYALVAAFATLRPNALLWPIPIRARTLVWALAGMTVLWFLVSSSPYRNFASESAAAHLGGLGVGWLLVRRGWQPGTWVDRLRLARLNRRRERLSGGPADPERRGGNGRTLH